MESFQDANRHAAEDARLALEIELSRNRISDEVVLLEASSEAALRRTHARYFNDIKRLLESASNTTSRFPSITMQVKGDRKKIIDTVNKCFKNDELIYSRILSENQALGTMTLAFAVAPGGSQKAITENFLNEGIEVLDINQITHE